LGCPRVTGRAAAEIRLFLRGGAASFHALFAWLDARAYLAAVVGVALCQVTFFATFAGFAGVPARFAASGNAFHVCAIVAIYGTMMTITREAASGTLPLILASPATRLTVVAGRCLLPILHASAVSGLALLFGAVVFGLPSGGPNLAATVFSVLACAFCCNGLGVVVGSAVLWDPDVHFAADLLYFLLMFTSGASYPLSALPGWVVRLAGWLPLASGVQAGRLALSGASLGQVAPLLERELLLGVGYTCIGYLAFLGFEWASRRAGTVEGVVK